MAKSGYNGGTPMVSRPGKYTIAQYLCFSNGVKQKNLLAAKDARKDQELKKRLQLEL